jgi:ribosomal protein S18 acetylase RimI-like enzyme
MSTLLDDVTHTRFLPRKPDRVHSGGKCGAAPVSRNLGCPTKTDQLEGSMQTTYRAGGAADVEALAALHADSWRRHYRGAYSDGFLDGDVVADRRAVWSARLAEPAGTATVLAEDGSGLVGFVHVVFDADPRWGSLVDNLHVARASQRGGIGRALLGHAAAAVREHAAGGPVYLWVLGQNTAAQRFYQAMGGTLGERGTVSAPGGAPGRLRGTPTRFRVTWPDAAALAAPAR